MHSGCVTSGTIFLSGSYTSGMQKLCYNPEYPSGCYTSGNPNTMSIGNFFLKQLLKSKMKDIPAAEQDKIFTILEKNPDLFKKIAEEAQVKIKSGKEQTAAIMDVINEHKEELQKIFGN